MKYRYFPIKLPFFTPLILNISLKIVEQPDGQRVINRNCNGNKQIQMQNNHEESESALEEMSKKIINFNTLLLDYGLPIPLIIILLTIETFQLIGMVLIDPLEYSTLGLPAFRLITDILYPHSLLKTTNAEEFLIPLFFCIVAAHLGVYARSFYKFTRGEQSRLKVIAHYFFVASSTLAAPGFLLNINIFTCSESSPYSTSGKCYEGFHIILLIMAFVNNLWLIGATAYKTLLYIDRNPFVSNYFSCSSNLWMLGNLVIKIAPPLYLIFDPIMQYNVLYIVSIAILNLSPLAIFRFFLPYYRNCLTIDTITLRFDALTLMVISSFIPIHFLSYIPANCVFVLSWVVGLAAGQQLSQFYKLQKEELKDLIIDGQFQKQSGDSYVQFFYLLIGRVEKSRNTSQKDYELLDLLKIHKNRCNILACPCYHLLSNRIISQEGLTLKEVYKIIKIIVDQIKRQLPNFCQLGYLQAYIEYERLGEKVKAICSFQSSIKPKTSLFDRIQISNIFFKWNEHNTEVTDMIKYQKFAEKLWHFEEMVENSAGQVKGFWRELIQQDCEISKLWRMCKDIFDCKNEVEAYLTDELLRIFPHNMEVKRLFLEVQLFVFRESLESVKQHFIKYKEVEAEEDQMANKLTFQQNSNMTVFCTVKEEGQFKFCNVSSNVFSLMGIRNIDIQGKPLNSILPDPIKKMHDDKMQRYFQFPDSQIKDRQTQVFIANANQKTISCSYFTKILPCLLSGVQLVCFMKQTWKKQPFCYITYYYSKENKKVGEFKSGNIVMLDPFVKEIYQLDQELETAYTISELLPDWDVNKQTYQIPQYDLQESEKENQLITNAELVASYEIQEKLHMKTIRVTYNLQKPDELISKDKDTLALPPLIQENKSSFLGSLSRDELVEHFHDKIKDHETSAMPMVTSEVTEKAWDHTISADIEKINQNYILVFFIITLALFGVCIIFNNYLSLKIHSDSLQDVQVIQSSSKAQKMLVKSATSLNSFLINQIQADQAEKDLIVYFQTLKIHTKILYSILGYEKIDKNIRPIIKIIAKNGSISQQTSTIFKAVAQFQAEGMSFLTTQDINSYTFVQKNWLTLFQDTSQTISISREAYQRNVKFHIQVLFGLNGAQLAVFFLFIVFLLFRMKRAFDFMDKTIQTYEDQVDIETVIYYEKECLDFIQRVKGRKISKFEEGEDMKDILNNLEVKEQVTSNSDNNIKPEEEENSIIQKNQEQFQKLRNKISFQNLPSIKKSILILVIVSFLTFSINWGVIYLWDIRFQEENHDLICDFLNNGHILERFLTKMLYYHKVNDQVSFHDTTNGIEQAVLNMSLNDLYPQNFTFSQILISLSKVYQQQFNQINYSELQEQSALFQSKIQSAMMKMNKIKSQRGNQQAIVTVAVFSICLLLIWKWVVVGVQFMVMGCKMMKKMLENPKKFVTPKEETPQIS